MDRSYPYSRRLLARARLHKRIAALAAAAMVGASALLMLAWKPDPIAAMAPAAVQLALADGPATVRGARRIYPYSVIPGGVSGQAELKRVIRTDRVVAAHYASFDVDKARPVAVGKPRDVYVSYRKGGKVFRTAHKVKLAEGETLLSDGRNEMRARCANRISDVAQYPVEPHRPRMEELDDAVELDDGEEYALGPDGLPVKSAGAGGMARHGGQRPPGGGSGIGGQPDATLASMSSSPSADIGSALGMSGFSSRTSSRPRPSAAPADATQSTSPAASSDATGPEGSGSSSSGPEPSLTGGPGTDLGAPGMDAGAGTGQGPATGGIPDTTTRPDADAPLPPVVTGDPHTGGGGTEALIPKPDLKPPAPQESVEEPNIPADVPEPGSIWLFGAALAALPALRRRARVKPGS